jgi:Spy/CpxP family protein refolding chaperone
MKILVASAFAICLCVAAVSASRAMPLAPLDQAPSADVIRVAGGCGPGWHRGPYGGCRPMYNCPPGWHSGPFGRRCFRNW